MTTQRCRDIKTVPDSAAACVRRAPLLAVSGAFAGGMIAALACALWVRALRRKTPTDW